MWPRSPPLGQGSRLGAAVRLGVSPGVSTAVGHPAGLSHCSSVPSGRGEAFARMLVTRLGPVTLRERAGAVVPSRAPSGEAQGR